MALPTIADAAPSHGIARWYYRHSLAVRIAHWINFVCLATLLMSGLNIFNAHPALYWGRESYRGTPILELSVKDTPAGPMGVTTVFGYTFDTTGVLGVSRGADGEPAEQGFPSWATIPDSQWLAMARYWHFFFAWLLVFNGIFYLLHSIASRHLARDLAPTKTELRGIGRSLVEHLKFQHPKDEAAKHYNVLQKLAYLVVIFGLLPLVIVMGWAMSPWLDSVLPGWVDIVGGRQSARTLHFLAAFGLLLFFLVHIFEVLISGAVNQVRSMITGRYKVESDDEKYG